MICELCDKLKFARGLCRNHYYESQAIVNGRCKIDGCAKNAKMGKLQLCQTHYYQTDDQVNKDLVRKYGITLDQYRAMFDAQEGKCAICLGQPKGRNAVNNRLDVDHCHTTGKVRGLLCSDCNTSLGKLSDDIGNLKRAIQYLEKLG